MTQQQWKDESGPRYTRLFELYAKAQDNGLTNEERREMDDLDQKVGELLHEFTASFFGAPPSS